MTDKDDPIADSTEELWDGFGSLTPPVAISPSQGIEILGLSVRAYNTLRRRGGIQTVGDLITALQLGRLGEIRNIGAKSIAEIEGIVAGLRLTQPPQTLSDIELETHTASQLRFDLRVLAARNDELENIVRLSNAQSIALIRKQLKVGLLHQDAIVSGRSIADWISSAQITEPERLTPILWIILGGSLNVCEELEYMLNGLTSHVLFVALNRFGPTKRTLEEIGAELYLTRERARQIESRFVKRVETETIGVRSISLISSGDPSGAPRRLPLLRIQSALLLAEDHGLDISFSKWKEESVSSGLIGQFQLEPLRQYDPIELLVATCNACCDRGSGSLRIPQNLDLAIQAAASGEPDLPARVLQLRSTLGPKLRKAIRRNTDFCGAVNVEWLAEENGVDQAYIKDALLALDYRAISGKWYARITCDPIDAISKNHVFHHALRKMFRYCGHLSVDDICGGMRLAVSRTAYPVPPPDVIAELLGGYSYDSEVDRFYYVGDVGEELSESEAIIMKCLQENGPVVHHSELAADFFDSGLSFPALHAALGHSPLFERVDSALYKLRGVKIESKDIERARLAAESTPANVEVSYDRRGYIVIRVSLGILAVSIGSIISAQFPNLAGSWKCLVGEMVIDDLEASSNEFHLPKQAREALNHQVGDRLQLTFNTWQRTVTIEKVSNSDGS